MSTETTLPPLDIAETLQGKTIMLIGSTGFVGKVAISMLLDRYPEIGKIVALVRPGMGNTAEDRFFKKVATSPAFDPVRDRYGAGFDAYLREKVLPVGGDIGRPLCNFTDEDFEAFEKMGGIDVIINSAGLVSFTPSLESAIRINAKGARNCLDVARRLDAALVHISTCYVAGRRDGDVWEDEEVVGYFPRRDDLVDDDFDADAEIADCERVIEQVRDLAKDRRHISMFRERAQNTLRSQRRDPDDKSTLKLSVARERKLWVHEKLTDVGMKRAEHWGWSNTYTYSKSLGEQVVLKDKTVRSCIVRPAIVESAVSFPKVGWNEGFNTTAPLVYAMLKGQRLIVTGDNTNLDIIPVDMVCTAIVMATAAVIRDEHKSVYQAGSSGINPVSSERLCELSGLAVRGYYRDQVEEAEGVDKWKNRMRARREAHAVSRDTFHRLGTPQVKRVVDRLSKEIDERIPRWGVPRLAAFAERAQEELDKVSTMSQQIIDLMDLFEPFIHDHDIAFRSDNLSELWARLPERDKDRMMWTPDQINWRQYWIESHFPGLIEWVFPVLDDEFGVKPRSVYTYKDMLELFDAAVKLNRHRVALRFLETEVPDAPPVVYTYERVGELARQVSGNLRDWGVVSEDRVALMGEGRPEWSISYFGILKAGATAVPMDSQLSLTEIGNLLTASEAKVLIISDKVCERLAEDGDVEAEAGQEREAVAEALAQLAERTRVVAYDDVLVEPQDASPVVLPARKGDRVASLIFTSGTTGQPKGVMLTHKNLTSMAAKLSSTFRLYKHDGLLSVLPMHHTFEFSAGLLMPLMHGASITYLDELNADALNAGFKCGHITGMVGVPALWQLLHRNVRKRVSERGPLVERAFDAIVDVNRAIREKTPLEVDLGRLVFFPVHRELGGRIRLMISGGSALSPDVMKSFRGMGFRLFEGYGMTEASPVLAVQRPGDPVKEGSVGRALPGISVQVFEPNEDGIGELIGKGPNVMKGYYGNEDATDEVIRDGWLHTGDLGRIDEDGNVFIVGRKKEMILGASGENVYPDELEELYGDNDYVKELSVVGLPSSGTGETVAALLVPDYEYDDSLSREAVRELVREHVKEVSKKLPLYKRVKLWHLWDHDLPKTSTRKVKRREIVTELEKLEKVASSASNARKKAESDDSESGDTRWVRDVVAQVSQRKPADVRPDSRMESLGFDSLMLTELTVALEAAGLRLPDPNVINELETVGDLETLAASQGLSMARDKAAKAIVAAGEHKGDEDIKIPNAVANAGRAALGTGQGMLYSRYLDTKVRGKSFIPPFGGFIVAANHSSHLDMGLVKHTLGEHGDKLVALAAKDYFFEDPVRKAYFENFTNLLPMERHGSLRESLRLAGEVLREGYILLIFPEGTRSTTGIMTDFKPSIGYLAMSAGCGILPMYLGGTHDAMPKGAYLPKRQEVVANVGPFQSYQQLAAMTEGLKRSESYRQIAYRMEEMVRDMAPTRYEWTLGESGRMPAASAVAAARNEVGV